MDEQSQDQKDIINPIGSIQAPSYGFPPYQSNQMMGTNLMMPGQSAASFPVAPTQLAQNQPSYQQIHQQQVQQMENQLKMFWKNQIYEISEVRDFKNHNLPLARIKKIMKADEDVRMIAAEAPVLFAKACEMFILELTLRSWGHTEENKRRTLQKNDIAAAITRTEAFDFLVDIVPRDEVKEDGLSAAPCGVTNESLPYYFPQQIVTPGIMMGKPVVDQGLLYTQPSQTFAPQPWPEEQQPYEQGSTTDT